MKRPDEKYLGRPVVITGAGADKDSEDVGFGYQTAEDLFAEGASVIILGRKQERLETASNRIHVAHSQSKGRLDWFTCDITDAEKVAEVFALIKETHGNVYGLVNNAAHNVRQPLAAAKLSDIRDVIETNVVGPMIVGQCALGHMQERGEGSIVNVSSIAAKQSALSNMTAYVVSKWGIEGLTASLARDYGKRGIRCNTVQPGYARTPLTGTFFDRNRDKLEKILAQQPIGGLVTPKQVSQGIRYYLDPDCKKNGWTLEINNGYSPIED